MARPDGHRSEREAWLQATLDGAGDGNAVLRAVRTDAAITDWVIVEANALVRQRWAAVGTDVIGMPLSVLDAAADNSALLAIYEAALTRGERRVTEVQLAVPGGLGGWRRIIVIPLDDDTISVVTRDITREHYFEAAAQRERHRLSHLAEGWRSRRSGTKGSVDPVTTRLSAFTLFVAAGLVSFVNSFVTDADVVDLGYLRMTGTVAILLGCALLVLPWERAPRLLGAGVVLASIALLGGSDALHHYSSANAALAIYPVFFVIIIAWSGLAVGRGAPAIVSLVCAPVLVAMFSHGGRPEIGWQASAIVLPAALILGEVLAYSTGRAHDLIQLEASRRLHDPLTGLANRAQLADRLDLALTRSRRSDGAVAVLFVDLDQFKQVNDTLGHAAGDELLVATAQRLCENVREADTVARFGGDEFVVLCEDVTAADATRIANRIIEALGEPFAIDAGEVRVGASIGIVLCTEGDETAETMLQKADIAMYRAKANGRGCFEMFDTAMQEWVSARVSLESALRAAVALGQLRLHYQPVVDTDDGRVVSFEALIRWERPGFGLVPPAEFIPMAEDTGLIADIGAWAIEEACRQVAVWSERWPDRRIGVAVNVSGRQLRKGLLLTQVDRAIAASGVDPRLLTLELTESTLIEDAVGVQTTLIALRDRGIRIAVDDFGTGYSSLTYLRTFPIDVIKIDRSFVRTVGQERGDTAIVAAVLALARNLELDVVAEGVETHEQLSSLMFLNCRFVQGFLFARPAPADAVEALVTGPPLGMVEPSAQHQSADRSEGSSEAGAARTSAVPAVRHAEP